MLIRTSACCSGRAERLRFSVNQQSVPQLRLEPGGLGRHDAARRRQSPSGRRPRPDTARRRRPPGRRSTARSSSPVPRMPPTKSIRVSVRGSAISSSGSSRRPAGTLTSSAPVGDRRRRRRVEHERVPAAAEVHRHVALAHRGGRPVLHGRSAPARRRGTRPASGPPRSWTRRLYGRTCIWSSGKATARNRSARRRRRPPLVGRARRWRRDGGRRRCRARESARRPRRAPARRRPSRAPDRVLHAVGRHQVEQRRAAVIRARQRRRRRPTRGRSGTRDRSARAAPAMWRVRSSSLSRRVRSCFLIDVVVVLVDARSRRRCRSARGRPCAAGTRRRSARPRRPAAPRRAAPRSSAARPLVHRVGVADRCRPAARSRRATRAGS